MESVSNDTWILVGKFATIASIIAIPLAFYLYKKTYPKLSFRQLLCLSLFPSIIERYDEIEINYKGNSIKNNLVLLQAKLINNGDVDIDKSMIYGNVSILSTENFKWVQVKINATKDSGNYGFSSTWNENEIIFNWDLFKKNGVVVFDILAEYIETKENPNNETISNKLWRDIKFDFGITNLNTISKETAYSILNTSRFLKRTLLFHFLVGFILAIGFNYIYKKYPPFDPIYRITVISIILWGIVLIFYLFTLVIIKKSKNRKYYNS